MHGAFELDLHRIPHVEGIHLLQKKWIDGLNIWVVPDEMKVGISHIPISVESYPHHTDQ